MTSSAAPASASGAQPVSRCLIHPLVVLSIADQETRCRLELNEARKRHTALGLLFAQQRGESIELVETVEIAIDSDDKVNIDLVSLEIDVRLFTACYPELQCYGFYYTSPERSKRVETHIKQQLAKVCPPQAIVMHMNPLSYQAAQQQNKSDASMTDASSESHPQHQSSGSCDLPLKVSLVDGSSAAKDLPWELVQSEAEQISMIHIAKELQQQPKSIAPSQSALSSCIAAPVKPVTNAMTPQIALLHKSLGALTDRVQILLSYLHSVRDKTTSPDHELLREIAVICNSLPLVESKNDNQPNSFAASFESAQTESYNAALLQTALAIQCRNIVSQHQVNTATADLIAKQFKKRPNKGGKQKGSARRSYLGSLLAPGGAVDLDSDATSDGEYESELQHSAAMLPLAEEYQRDISTPHDQSGESSGDDAQEDDAQMDLSSPHRQSSASASTSARRTQRSRRDKPRQTSGIKSKISNLFNK